MPPFIQLRGTVFGTEEQALTGATDLQIEPGEKILLEGPSGAGKTSLLRGILGFIPRLNGSYLIHGEEASDKAIWTLRQNTSYVSQELSLGNGPVHTWLREHLPDQVHVHDSDLAKFHLSPSIMEQTLEELSRGERQRLAMVLAVLKKPHLYLLDEITSALNEELRLQVIRLFAAESASVIVVSHDDCWQRNASFRVHPLTGASSS